MTREERAELAFRIAGIAMLVLAASSLVWYGRIFLDNWGASGGRGWATFALELRSMIFPAILGGILLGFPAALAGKLAGRGDALEDHRSSEFLEPGIVLIGLWAVAVVLVLLPWPSDPSRGGLLTSSVVTGLLGVCLIVWSSRLTSVLARRAEAAGVPDHYPGITLTTGLCVMCLYVLVTTLITLIHTIAYAPANGMSASATRVWRASWVAAYVTGLALSVLLLVFSGRAVARFARGLPPPPPDSTAPSSLSRPACVELAVFVGAAYFAVKCFVHLPSLVGAILRQWEAPHGWLQYLAVPAAAGAIALLAAARIARGIGGRFYPRESPPSADGIAVGRLAAEVGITVVVLGSVISQGVWRLWPVGWRSASLVLLLALLALRGDVALLWRRGESPARTAGADLRARMLYPWLVLLGVWLVLRFAPRAVQMLITSFFPMPELTLGSGTIVRRFYYSPLFGLAVALVLVVAAGRLSKWLSYGPLLARLRRGRPSKEEPADGAAPPEAG